MSSGTMAYVVLVAVVGMLVVFGFLLLLSFLMTVIKRIMGDREQRGAPAADLPTLRTKPGPSTSGARSGGVPAWVVAAVAAFVSEENESRTATPWIEGRRA